MTTARYQQSDAIKMLQLGKTTDYVSFYSPNLLQAVPRQLNRDDLNISAEQGLPFEGFDWWNLYELSWLNSKGKPQVALGVAQLPADSPNLIESKSFKLYLNSLNQTQFDSREQLCTILEQDLSNCAGGKVSVSLFDVTMPLSINNLPGECIDELDIHISDYRFSAALLENAIDSDGELVQETLHSHLLKSNCLVTNQPDWGSVLISYKGRKINREALLRYIISFREHNEFHEQCVERIYCDLMRFCQCEKLSVYARYTRRGGLDINPARSNDAQMLQNLSNARLARQ